MITKQHFITLWAAVSISLSMVMLPQVSSATTVADSHISSVSASTNSDTLSGVATYTVEFVTSTAMSSGEWLNIDFNSTSGCNDEDWQNCLVNLSNASLSGINGTAEMGETTATLNLESDLSAGTHTITISNAVNPESATATRVFVNASSSDEEALLGDAFDSDNWYSTADSEDELVFGTPLIYGHVVNVDDNTISSAWLDLHDDSWSVSGSTSADEYGYFALFSDYFDAEYWENGEYTLSAYPGDHNPDYINTNVAVTYAGVPLSQDIILDEAIYFFGGQVTYGENTSTTVNAEQGDVVDDAIISFNAEDGSGSFSANVDENGNYTVPVAAGDYRVSINRNGDELVDWYYDDWETVYSISEEGTQTVNFEVTPTNAIVSGALSISNSGSGNNNDVDLSGWLSLSSETAQYGGSTDSEGNFEFNLNAGTYTVTWEPNSDNTTAQAYSFSGTQTISVGTNSYNISLSSLTSTINFTVLDSNGNPVEDIYAQAWSENFYRSATTDGDGQVTLYVPSNTKLEASVWHDQYLNSGSSQSVKLADNESVDVEFIVAAPNATVDVTLASSDGTVPDSLHGYVWCETNDYSQHFGNDFFNGTTSISVLVDESDGVFEGMCNAWIAGDTYSVDSSQEISVAIGETEQVNFTLLEKDATVRVNVKNFATGQLITPNEDINVNLWNKDNTWVDDRLSTNPVDIAVVSGKIWHGSIWSHNSQYIPLWNLNSNKSAEPDSGETESLILNVLEQDGSVGIAVSGPNNETVEYGWAWCGNWNDQFIDSENAIVDSGAEIINGVAEVSLVAGYTYTCGVGLPPEFVELGWMSPSEQTVKFTNPEQILNELSFQFLEADATLTGTVNVNELNVAAGDVDHVWCWAWSEDGGHSFTEVEPGEQYQLNVQSGRTWYAGCDAQADSTWYWSEEHKFEASAGDNQHNFTLNESPWILFDAVSETFDATENKVITTPDGTSVTIPASTLATSGNVTVTATPVNQIVRTDDNPLVVPWDWEATNADGQLIETFNGQVTMTIPYDEELINEFSVDESSLFGKYYDDVSGEWKLPDNMTIDKDTNTITILTDHFSQYGAVYNARLAAVTKPKAPKRITIKQRTQHSVRYSVVLKASSERPTKLKHQFRSRKHGLTGKWTTWQYKDTKRVSRDSEKTKWTLQQKKLESNTKYQVRARFCNSAGCSTWVRKNVRTR